MTAFEAWWGEFSFTQPFDSTESDCREAWQAAIAYVKSQYTLCEKEPSLGEEVGPLYRKAKDHDI